MDDIASNRDKHLVGVFWAYEFKICKKFKTSKPEKNLNFCMLEIDKDFQQITAYCFQSSIFLAYAF